MVFCFSRKCLDFSEFESRLNFKRELPFVIKAVLPTSERVNRDLLWISDGKTRRKIHLGQFWFSVSKCEAFSFVKAKLKSSHCKDALNCWYVYNKIENLNDWFITYSKFRLKSNYYILLKKYMKKSILLIIF